MKTQNLGMITPKLLNQINCLVTENASLRQQVLEQHKIMKDIQLHNVSKDVAKQLDRWMDKSYEDEKTEQEDIRDFAFNLTKYIEHKLNN